MLKDLWSPTYWMRHWSIQDKQAFWSALSTRHGGHNVVTPIMKIMF